MKRGAVPKRGTLGHELERSKRCELDDCLEIWCFYEFFHVLSCSLFLGYDDGKYDGNHGVHVTLVTVGMSRLTP